MAGILSDLRYGARSLARRPTFTLVAVLTLAAGIGANTAIFSAVNSVLLRPLPFSDPEHLVTLWETHPILHRVNTGYSDFQDWLKQSHSFASLAAFTFQGFQKLSLVNHGEPRELQGCLISRDLFPMLGVAPALGRTFLPEEEQPGHDRVAMLSHDTWIRHFSGDPKVIGQTADLNGEAFRIVGILPRGRGFPVWAEVFLPISRLSDFDRTTRKYHQLEVVGRVRPGVSLAQANVEMGSIAQRLGRAYPATNNTIGAEAVPFREQFVAEARRPLTILLAAVGLILLIACANVANLLLAHGAGRQREMAVRAALGASRFRLMRQLLAESLLLALAGSIPGLLLAARAASLLAVLSPDAIKLTQPSALDSGVLWFTLGIAGFTAVAFGLLPALAGSRVSLNAFLSQRGSAGGPDNLRNLLVAGEVALAVVVLISAGLLVRSFTALLAIDPGFRSDHVLTMQIAVAGSKYSKPEKVTGFYQHLLLRVAALPGVEAAATANNLPLTSNVTQSRFGIDGEPPPGDGRYPVAQLRVVTTDYFRVLRVALRQGRLFIPADDNGNLLIINETLARRFYHGRDPIGRKILMGVVDPNPVGVPIVGVVADTREDGLNVPAEPEIYFPGESGAATLILRTKNEPLSLAPAVRAEVAKADREQPVSRVRTMEDVLDASVARRRWAMTLLGGFSGLALLLAAIGLYGVLAYTVTARTREIGLRIALGAQQGDVFGLVLKQGMAAALGGLVTGILLAMVTSRWLTNQLYGISGLDPQTYVAVSLLLIVVAFAAIAVPARRAIRIVPLDALRYE